LFSVDNCFAMLDQSLEDWQMLNALLSTMPTVEYEWEDLRNLFTLDTSMGQLLELLRGKL